MRIGKGKGKGKGWRNIIASDHYRHVLAGKGIASRVTIPAKTKNKIRSKLLPLLANHTISGYNLVENPRIHRLGRYQLVYSHDVKKKHRDLILRELRRRNMDYYAVPRESQFLDEEAFVKRPSQIRKDDIVSNKHEYQIFIDANAKQLRDFEAWLRRKAVNWNEPIQFFDGLVNPLVPVWEVIPLKGADTTPDIRILKRQDFPRFKPATKIIKKIDKDSDLVILSVRKKNTAKVRRLLKGETAKRILVQDYTPERYSLHKFIKRNTKMR